MGTEGALPILSCTYPIQLPLANTILGLLSFYAI